MSKPRRFTNATGAPVPDNTNILTAGRRGPALLQDIWLIEKLAHFDREVIPERRMHAKGWGAYGTFTTTHDITKYTKAAIFSKIGITGTSGLFFPRHSIRSQLSCPTAEFQSPSGICMASKATPSR